MRFATDDFSWLNDDERYLAGWNNISLDDLQDHVSDDITPEMLAVIDGFSSLLNAVGALDTSIPTLSFKIDKGGMVEIVSAPAIYASQDEDTKELTGLAFRAGDFSAEVTVDGSKGKAFINGLEGDIAVEERGEDPNKYCVVQYEHFIEELDDGVEISFRLNTEDEAVKSLKKAKLKNLVSKDELLPLMQPVPSGQAWTKPRDLDIGEYLVVSIEELDEHSDYGRSWKIQVEGVGPVVLRSKRNKNLLANKAPNYITRCQSGHPLTYAISKKKEMAQGISVTDGFFERAPREDRIVVTAKPAQVIAQTSEVAALPEATQTVTTTAQPVEQKTLEHAF